MQTPFQYSRAYGAPATVAANYAMPVMHASPTASLFKGSMPMQSRVPRTAASSSPTRTLTLTHGSDPDTIVVLYDASNRVLGALNARQLKASETKSVRFAPHPTIARVQVWVNDATRALDLRQAQGWLNSIQHVGVTVGFDGSGQLIGSLANMDAVHNIYPDRDGVTLGTKCTYMINARGTEGALYCA